MSAETKPIIIIVPGAWCPSSVYELLTSRLQKAAHQVHALDLPSNGNPPNLSSDWQPDVQLISSTVQKYADDGEDIVIVAHSAGGATSTEATKGLSKVDRQARGQAGGVVRLVLIAAFVPDVGPTVVTLEQSRAIFPWVIFDGEIDYPDPRQAKGILFNDLPDEEAESYAAQLQESAWRARHSAYTIVTYAGWKHIPCSYLLCRKDKTVVPEMQEMWIAQEGGMFDDVVRLDIGHCPFLSRPEFVESFVRRAAGEKDVQLD